jgi:FKBP-type peptidyl-prolyl cis-trans isomerase SlyD
MASCPVGADTVVTLSYMLFDERGQLVEEVKHDNPVQYLHGSAELLPGMEAALEGCEAGDAFSLELAPEDAFGDHNEQAILEIDRHDFPAGEGVAEGDELVAELPGGGEALHRVTRVDDDVIVLDLNHPLAGQRVRFELQVLSVRPATDDEIDASHGALDERIAFQAAIVYDTPSADGDHAPQLGAAPQSLVQPQSVIQPQPLIQLSRKPAAKVAEGAANESADPESKS